MTPDQLAKLRALAQGATPGPWRWGDWRTTFGLLESEFRLTLERNLTYGAATECVPRNRGDGCHLVLQVQDEIDPNNATFIAAASPDVVLALLDEVAERDALAQECEKLRNVVEAAKAWRASLSIIDGGQRRIIEHETAWVLKVALDALDSERKPVCATCNDTHAIEFRGAIVMCTRCPVPCLACRCGGNGPFCEVTPCACDCHRKPGP